MSSFTAEEKLGFLNRILALLKNGMKVKDACTAVGISTSSYYKWREQAFDRFNGNPTALEAQSRRPKAFGNRYSGDIEQQVIDSAMTGQYLSASSLKGALADRGLELTVPTIIRILEDQGLYGYVFRENSKGVVKKVRGIKLDR